MSNKVGSLFSGIGSMDKGLQDAGWEITWQVEIDRWCRRVLAARFPSATQYGDIRDRRDYSPVDLLSFGFPCTDLSVAGKREGLGGDESRLFWAAMVVARRLKPPWLLVENVPGLLSSNQGRDFGIVLGALAHLGYWWSYRVLDSQYFGVPQRRRRVYIVGHLGAPVPPEVLFESAGLSGHPAQGRRARKEVASSVTASAGHHGYSSPRGDGSDTLVPSRSHPLLAKGNSSFDDSLETYVVNARQNPVTAADLSLPLDAGTVHAVAQPLRAGRRIADSSGDEGNVVVVGPSNHRARALNQGGGPGASSGYVIQDARGTRQKRQNGIGIQQGGPSYTLDGVSQHAISEEIDPDRVREAPGAPGWLHMSLQGVTYGDGMCSLLCFLWCTACSEAVSRWPHRGPVHVQEETILQLGLCEACEGIAGRVLTFVWEKACPTAVLYGFLRQMWNEDRTDQASRRWQYLEQQREQHLCLVPQLPHEGGMGVGHLRQSPDTHPTTQCSGAVCRCSDSPRYRGLGNGVTATVAEWIGRRLLALQLQETQKRPG